MVKMAICLEPDTGRGWGVHRQDNNGFITSDKKSSLTRVSVGASIE